MKTRVKVEIEDARIQLIKILVGLDKNCEGSFAAKTKRIRGSSRENMVKYLPVLDEDGVFEGGYKNVLCQISQVSKEFLPTEHNSKRIYNLRKILKII